MQIFQQPDKVTMIYRHGNEVRRVRLNEPHPAQVTPSWYGDSVGHYEGDTLVIDTVGIKIGPYAMVDMYGTPHSPALHVVERYRLIDYDEAKDALERNDKENSRAAGGRGDSTPTTAARCCSSISPSRTKASSRCRGRRPSPIGAHLGEWTELICAENPREFDRKESRGPDARTSRISEWDGPCRPASPPSDGFCSLSRLRGGMNRLSVDEDLSLEIVFGDEGRYGHPPA